MTANLTLAVFYETALKLVEQHQYREALEELCRSPRNPRYVPHVLGH